jgi:hypothetical protein
MNIVVNGPPPKSKQQRNSHTHSHSHTHTHADSLLLRAQPLSGLDRQMTVWPFGRYSFDFTQHQTHDIF